MPLCHLDYSNIRVARTLTVPNHYQDENRRSWGKEKSGRNVLIGHIINCVE
jgi:hypothetical protein